MRAIVVVHNGRIIGERYANGFSADTPLARMVDDQDRHCGDHRHADQGRQARVGHKALFEPWRADARAGISLADLMAMSSGLEFNEDYGDVTDVTRMLYLEPDMAGFAATKPLTGEIGKTWSYSSGTTMLLSRIWQRCGGRTGQSPDLALDSAV